MPAFVDTNVAVYALGRDSDKKALAKQILDEVPIASSQVINEVISVLIGKQQFAREEAYAVADAFMKLVPIAPLKPKLRLGVLKGRIKIADDFDAPLVDDVLGQYSELVDLI